MRKQEAFEQEGQASAWRHALPTPYGKLIFLLCTSKDEHTLSRVNRLRRTHPTQVDFFGRWVKTGLLLSPTGVRRQRMLQKHTRPFPSTRFPLQGQLCERISILGGVVTQPPCVTLLLGLAGQEVIPTDEVKNTGSGCRRG